MKIAAKNHASWDDLKSQLKIRYPILKDADLYCIKGQEEEMLRMVEYKLRKTKQEMKDIIEKF
jgi:hypothetical protein